MLQKGCMVDRAYQKVELKPSLKPLRLSIELHIAQARTQQIEISYSLLYDRKPVKYGNNAFV